MQTEADGTASISEATRRATTLVALDEIEKRVYAESVHHVPARLARLENRRSAILDSDDPGQADIAAWLAQLLNQLGGLDLSLTRNGPPFDVFADASRVPTVLYSRAYAKSQAAPLQGRHVWLRALWGVRDCWQAHAVELGLPRFDLFARECARVAADAADALHSKQETMAAFFAWEGALECLTTVAARDVARELLPRLAALIDALVAASDFWAVRLLTAEVKFYASKQFKTFGTPHRLDLIEALTQELDRQLVPHGFNQDALREELVEVQAGLARLRGVPMTSSQRAALLATIKVASATQHPHPLARATWWEEAAGLLQQAGDSAGAAAAMERSRREVERANAEGAFKVITYEHKVKRADVMKSLEPFLAQKTCGDALLALSARYFVPWFDEPSARTMPSGVAATLIPRGTIVGTRIQPSEVPHGASPTPGAVSEAIAREIILGAQLQLVPFFQAADKKFDDLGGALMSVFCASPGVAEYDVSLLERSVVAFSEGDFVVSAHLLPPRLEQIIHRTLRARGASVTTRPTEGGLQERTFGSLLQEARTTGAMSDDLTRFLQLVLTDEQGLNLRNKIAHGWLPSSAFNAVLAARLLHTALVVVRWSLDDA